jgi:hypothetical protein
MDKISLELDKEELDLLYLGVAKLYLREKANIHKADLYHRVKGVHTTDIYYYEKLLDKLLNANILLELNDH